MSIFSFNGCANEHQCHNYRFSVILRCMNDFRVLFSRLKLNAIVEMRHD
jgi:hypothetical protein